MRRIRKRHVLLTVLAVLVLGQYTACVHRFHRHVEAARWSVDFSFILCACPFCRGQVEQLTFDGKPIVPPDFGPNERTSLVAPVGSFEAVPGEGEYRSHGVGALKFCEAGEVLTGEELARGYYDADVNGGWPPPRRPGTPEHWCLLNCNEFTRWLDPARLGEYTQATTQAATSSAPDTSQPSSETQPGGG